MACSCFGSHHASAVAAKQFSAQNIRFFALVFSRLVLVFVHHGVAIVKQLFIHDWRYDVGVNCPVRIDDTDILFVTDYPCKAVHIKRRTCFRSDSLRIKPVYDILCFLAVFVPCKHIPNDIGFVSIYCPFFIHDVISEQSVSADEIAFDQTFPNAATNLLRKFGRIILRHTLKHPFHKDSARVLGYVFLCGQNAHAVLL